MSLTRDLARTGFALQTIMLAAADLPYQGIFGREEERRSGAGYGGEIPDAALHTWLANGR
jgi:hypothetical protein